jgi:hypothetical protein
MTCAVLTNERLSALLAGTLSRAERPVIEAHLSSPCDACLDLLAGPEGEGLLERIAGAGLSAAEADRAFAAAIPVAARGPHWMLRTSVALGAVLAAAAVAIAVRPRNTEILKGPPLAPHATLVALVGKPGAPDSIRLLPPGLKIERGEVLLLRARLSAPAFVYLLALGDGAPQLLWQTDGDRPHAGGEFELTLNGETMAIDPRALGRSPKLAVIAAPRALEPSRVLRLPGDEPSLIAALPECGVDVLRLEVSP